MEGGESIVVRACGAAPEGRTLARFTSPVPSALLHFILPIARFTFLEALRGRLLVLTAIAAALVLGLGGFLAQVALIEARAVAGTIMAAVLRASAVFLLITFATASVGREWNDKGADLVLSLPLPRVSYVLGRFVGLAAIALPVAFVVALPLLLYAHFVLVVVWTASLWIELVLMAAAALFCALALNNTVASLAVVIAFYLLARTVDAIQALAHASSGPGFLDRLATHAVDVVALVLPPLDRMTSAAFLVALPDHTKLLPLVGAATVYIVLLVGATLFDFYRRDF